MVILVFIVGFVFGVFAFSQVVYPLFSAWPRARKLQLEQQLIKPIPVASFIIAPIIWGFLALGSIWVVNALASSHLMAYFLALGISLVMVIAQIPKKNRNLEDDFKTTWRNYLKNSN